MRHCNILHVLPILLIVPVTASRVTAGALTCATTSIHFEDAFAGCQLLVSDGEQDVTRAARYESGDPAVARVDARGYVTPAGDGATQIRIQHGSGKREIPVRVSGFGSGRPVDFQREIVP
ncbi:MAG TPA: hypothetical protein VKE94_23710, partial [Gemmataceae bacterium]|nr:hypothetical protein [Gemmataceae bacterium]